MGTLANSEDPYAFYQGLHCLLRLKQLSKLLTSCLTAVKKHVIKYCEKVYERSGKNYFGLLKIQVKF